MSLIAPFREEVGKEREILISMIFNLHFSYSFLNNLRATKEKRKKWSRGQLVILIDWQ